MILAFGDVELDADKGELRRDGAVLAVEPRVFALLWRLADNSERLVTREELLETVWAGRVVSDSALSTVVKGARKAVGDSGSRQAIVRTVHGRGFRCVADVRRIAASSASVGDVVTSGPDEGGPPAVALTDGRREAALDGGSGTAPERHPSASDALAAADTVPGGSGRSEPFGKPSIAVLAFRAIGETGAAEPLADAVPAELISALSRLRWLHVIARGSSFRLRGAEASPADARRLLGVRYCLTGTVERFGSMLTLSVELADTGEDVVIWAERWSASLDGVHVLRAEIVAGVISALELRVPLAEAERARLAAPDTLDAWAAYHLGLQHMYRFNRADNAIAAERFGDALAREPHFARAHAGLSFTSFQSAFMNYADEPAVEIERAVRAAERGVALDPMDPFVNFSMGRTHWLVGDIDASLGWLDRALALSPSFAQGHYARAWTDTLSGRNESARTSAGAAMRLSPLDPMYYAMLGTHALSYIGDGDPAEASAWADRAARSPGAHSFIQLIAAAAHRLAGNGEQAARWLSVARERQPGIDAERFFRSFPYAEGEARERLERVFGELGL